MSAAYGSSFRTGPGWAFTKNSSKSLSILPHYRRTPTEQGANTRRTKTEQQSNTERTASEQSPNICRTPEVSNGR
jgi:hypothetical protein